MVLLYSGASGLRMYAGRMEDEQMELSLQLIAVGDTTSREISKASQDMRDALERLQGVAQIDTVEEASPDQAKGVAEAVGKFLVSLAPAALRVVMQALKTVLGPHPQTKVLIQTKGGKFSFEFDPKTVSLQDLVAAADRLRAAAPQS
jgi:hypothetical protein